MIRKLLTILFGDRAAAFGTSVIVLSMLMGISGWVIHSYYPELPASRQHHALTKLKPLATVQLLKVARNGAHDRGNPLFQFSPYDKIDFLETAVEIEFRGKSQLYPYADVVYHLGAADLATLNWSGETVRFDHRGERLERKRADLIEQIKSDHMVSRTYLLGTDTMGRDFLLRLLAGASTSVTIGMVAVLMALLIGVGLGLLSGYFGGWIDRFVLWWINLFWSIPAVLLVIATTLALGTGMGALTLGIGLVLWIETAQVTRFAVASLRKKDFIKASRLMGLSHGKVIWRHILPNAVAPVAVITVACFADAIVLEAGLSFLGIGVAPPDTSWGAMIRESYGYLITGRDVYLALIPSVVLMLLVLAFVLLGKSIRNSFEIGLEQRRRGAL